MTGQAQRGKSGAIQPWLDWNAWAIPRPRLTGWFESNELAVGIDVGNGSSDPLVSVGIQIKLRPRIANWLDWLFPDGRGTHVAKGWCQGR